MNTIEHRISHLMGELACCKRIGNMPIARLIEK